MDQEERLAVFIDYENLALGAREHLGGMSFDFGPIADALAVRGRVVVRRAYADWSYFDEDRRALTRHQVELIEMPQRMGMSRKNAADIKMVVDAIEMAFERDYISTFVMCTGDSDFSPLVHKLRELNKRVIGVGVEKSTSKLLPPACDEFLFYDRLEGVDVPDEPEERRGRGKSGAVARRRTGGRGRVASTAGGETASAPRSGSPVPSTGTAPGAGREEPPAAEPTGTPVPDPVEDAVVEDHGAEPDEATMEVRVAQTLADLQASQSGSVTGSGLKRALLRKDPTFSEAEYGFRSFGEFLQYLADRDVVELTDGGDSGDARVSLPAQGDLAQAFALLREIVVEAGAPRALSGLKNGLRKRQPAFSEKALGFRGFLQFAKAAREAGVVEVEWDDDADDYLVSVAATR